MKKFLGRIFALSLVIAATATAPVPSEAATCTCTQAERFECRVGCAEAGCQANFYCDWTTCVCQCICP
jgi:hypothetical protein